MWIFSQSHPFTLSSLFFFVLSVLYSAPRLGRKFCMEVCKFVRKATSAPFFAIIAWKLGIFELRAWYRDDASPIEPIDIYSELGGNSSVIIPFTNPTER